VAQAFDSAGRGSTKYLLGQVPFGSSVVKKPITFAMQNSDSAFRARLLAVEGNLLAVSSWPGQNSDKVLRFDITNPLSPVYVDTTVANNNFIWDMAIRNGYVYVASDDIRVINMNVTPSALSSPDRFTDNYSLSIAIDGTNAWVSTDSFSGRIQTFDLTNPVTPHWVRNQDLLNSVVFHKLIPYGTNYLIAITPYLTNDVIVIDRTDLTNLKIVAQLPISGLAANTATLQGNLLYVTERGGANSNVAIVDLTNPLAPVVKSVTKTRGYTFGVRGSGTVVAVGDGSPGVTLLDATDTTAPVVLGTQFLGGQVWDAAFQNGVLWCATENGIAGVQAFNVASAAVPDAAVASSLEPRVTRPVEREPLRVDASRVFIEGDGGAIAVTGGAKAIQGDPPLEIEIRNKTTGAFVAHVPVGRDGSFSGVLSGAAGDTVVIRVTDSHGRISDAVPVGVVATGISQ
jgi:hypothetical protein